MSTAESNLDLRLARRDRRVWDFVSHSPLQSLWNLQGIPVRVVALRTWKSAMADRIFGHAAELGFYFLFAKLLHVPWPPSLLGDAFPDLRDLTGRLI